MCLRHSGIPWSLEMPIVGHVELPSTERETDNRNTNIRLEICYAFKCDSVHLGDVTQQERLE